MRTSRFTVLQLVDSFHQGGSERQAVQLARLLRQSGRFSVRVASLNAEGILRGEVEALDCGEIPSFPLNTFYDLNALLQLRRLIKFVKSSRIDILHTHDFYTNIVGMAAGKLAGVPVRIASRRETRGMRTDAQQRAQRLAYSLAIRIVANSESVRAQLIREGIRANKVSVIYNGINLERVSPNPKVVRGRLLSLLGLPAETNARRNFVTIVANMRHDVKDYPMFLRAARQVSVAVPEAAFLLAGEGELTESLQALARELSIENNTFFLGRCDRLAELLSVSDVCVLSSKAEGFSNSILEYMAAARPVVATDVGGANEAIIKGETGYLVTSGDELMMAERIISLLREPEKARAMGELGRRVVQERFSREAQLSRTEALYEELLAEKGVSRGDALEQK